MALRVYQRAELHEGNLTLTNLVRFARGFGVAVVDLLADGSTEAGEK